MSTPAITPEILARAADALGAWVDDHVLEDGEMWPSFIRPSRPEIESIVLDLLNTALNPSPRTHE